MLRFYIVLNVCLLVQSVPVLSMFTTVRNRFYVGRMRPASSGYIGQKRYQSRPAQLKGQSRIIKNNIAPTQSPDFSVQGAAVANSHFLNNVVSHHQSITNATDPLVVLTNELFKIEENGTISIVMDQGTVSRLLTPEFFGLLRGAQEKDVLENPEVVTNILTMSKAEAAKVGSSYSEEKMKKFIGIMNDVRKSKTYFEVAQPLEDAYLFLRSNPHNSHDFIHYLLGFNTYSTILSDSQIKVFQELPWPISEYDNNDHRIFHETLSKMATPKEKVQYAKDNFPLAISAIIDAKRNRSLYCPKVEMGHVSYKGNPVFSTCAESAFLDLLRNLCFDEAKNVLDPVGFFPGLPVKKELITFFDKCNAAKSINVKTKDFDPQKDFVNLVSGIDGIKYVNNGYEISSMHNEKNLIKLCNYFFSVDSSNLSELGKMLSSNRRTISFDISNRDAIYEIAIKIDDNATHKAKYMYLYFQPGHSWFKVGNKQEDKAFFDTNALIMDHNDPRSKSLLYVHPQPIIDNLFFRKIQKNIKDGGSIFEYSLYYTFPVRDDHEKGLVITAILLYSNKDPQALNYAKFLFKSLSENKQKNLKNDLSKWGTLDKLDNISSIGNDFITLIE